MPSVLFRCCMNLLFFLSPDFKYVRACVKVCVRNCKSFFFYQLVTCLDVFLFPLRITSEVSPPSDDTGSCMLLTVFFVVFI